MARLNGKLILLRHHRHAIRAFLNEMPMWFSRSHESGEETAKREIRKELITDIHNLAPLGQIHPDSGKLGDAVFGALIDVTNIGGVQKDEAITGYELLDEKKLTHRIANNEITDAFTLSIYVKAVARKIISAQW